MTCQRGGPQAGLRVQVEVEVRTIDGELVSSYTGDPDDLTMDNFINWFEAFVSPVGRQDRNATMVDKVGTSRTVRVYEDGTDSNGYFNTHKGGVGIFLGLGDGAGSAVTPARSNFALDNEVFFSRGSNPFTDQPDMTSATSFHNGTGSSITIREAGLFEKWQNGLEFLLFHDAVADQVVNDDEVVTVAYTLGWP